VLLPDGRIHDVGYKYLFSNRTIFRQLLETFVPETWAREADFEAAETLDKSYISDHFKETESDLLYNVPLRDSEVYLYILLEFQSTVPRFMALHYLTSFYDGLCEIRQKDP
jgi:predicted transposase YdaD